MLLTSGEGTLGVLILGVGVLTLGVLILGVGVLYFGVGSTTMLLSFSGLIAHSSSESSESSTTSPGLLIWTISSFYSY